MHPTISRVELLVSTILLLACLVIWLAFFGLFASLLAAETVVIEHAVLRNGDRVLPPVKYDHPYAGVLVTTRAKTIEAVRELCKLPLSRGLGCAHRYATGCWIVMATDDIIEAAGWDPEIVRRHEIGHCNGWPKDHEGARMAPKRP